MACRRVTDLLIRLDPEAGEGLQQQIYRTVRRAILEGSIGPGQRLPSSRALAADLGVSRTTTVLALEQLVAEGYLAARHGSGTFVASELPDDLPHGRLAHRFATDRHPPLSRRGAALARLLPPAGRLEGPPRAFRLGVPALDLFPIELWWRLCQRRLRAATLAQLDYGDVAGSSALRQAIADHVRAARGTRCEAEQVFVVAGAQRGLEWIGKLLLDAGDSVWLEEPGYPGARSAMLAAGAHVVPVRVDAEGLDVTAGTRRAARARMALVTPSHQFPCGVAMSLPRRLALLRWASEADAWVVEDDYDSEFRHGTRPIPCLHGLDVDGRVIYVGSFSKTLFPALRLGFVIVPGDLGERLRAARRAADVHPPRLDQAVLAEFISEGHYERHLRRMRRVYGERLEALHEAAQRLGGGALRLRPVRTGLHAVADLQDVDATAVALEAAARGVEVRPLSAYCAGPSRDNALVLGFSAVGPERLASGMERLVAAIERAGRPARGLATS